MTNLKTIWKSKSVKKFDELRRLNASICTANKACQKKIQTCIQVKKTGIKAKDMPF